MPESKSAEHVGHWKGRRVYKLEDGSLAQERDKCKHLIEMSDELVELFKQKQQNQNQEV